MSKPMVLKGNVKHQARAEDRDSPTQPANNAVLWARGLTTTRVADLFRSLPGLRGHWDQLQNSVNAGNYHFYSDPSHVVPGYGRVFEAAYTSSEGKELCRWIADAVISAAEQATFDFPLEQLEFTRDMGWLKLYRQNGQVIVRSRP